MSRFVTNKNPFKADVYTSTQGVANPLTGSMFLLEPTATPEPAPTYGYDETGVVLKGTSSSLLV